MRPKPLLHRRSHSFGGLGEKRKLAIISALDRKHRRPTRAGPALRGRRSRQRCDHALRLRDDEEAQRARADRFCRERRRCDAAAEGDWGIGVVMQCGERLTAAAEIRSGRGLATELNAQPQTHERSRVLQALTTDRRNERAVLQEELRRGDREPQHVPEAA